VACRHGVEYPVHVGLVGHVQRMRLGIADRARGALRLGQIAIEQHGARSRRDERLRGCPPDAARASGDQRDLAIEAEAVERVRHAWSSGLFGSILKREQSFRVRRPVQGRAFVSFVSRVFRAARIRDALRKTSTSFGKRRGKPRAVTVHRALIRGAQHKPQGCLEHRS
jgi:hypothetical protein